MAKRLDDMVGPQPRCTLADRLVYCRAMLSIWGMMTFAESERVKKRLLKAYKTHAKLKQITEK